MAMNPFDEIALQEAVNLKEKGCIQEIIAVTMGSLACQDILRAALARGADSAWLIETPEVFPALAAAQCLQALVIKEQADLVFLGKQAIDDDCHQTAAMLASLLEWPLADAVSEVQWFSDRREFEVTVETDQGLELWCLATPCVLAADLRLNIPAFLSLPQIIKAKTKPLTILPIAELVSLNLKTAVTLLQVEPPLRRKAGVLVGSVAELLDKLRNEAKVLP